MRGLETLGVADHEAAQLACAGEGGDAHAVELDGGLDDLRAEGGDAVLHDGVEREKQRDESDGGDDREGDEDFDEFVFHGVKRGPGNSGC